MRNSLPQRRAKRNWTQAELAAAVAVSRQTIVSIENGRYDPSLPLAFRLAKAFDVRIEDLFTPDDGRESRPRHRRSRTR